MELTLHTETTLDSCHKLEGYDGKCKNLHGHTWLVEAWFKADDKYRDKVGILVDFGIMKQLKEELCHKNLNEIVKANPTAETLTVWIYNFLRRAIINKQALGLDTHVKVKVRVHETAVSKKTWCEGGDF